MKSASESGPLFRWLAVLPLFVAGCDQHASVLATDAADRLMNRGLIHQSVDHLNAAIELDESNALAYGHRAGVQLFLGKHAQAREDFEKAAQFDTEGRHAFYTHNGLAWMLATCPISQYRDGTRAVEIANAACEMTDWQDGPILDTLAAAYAEVGDFASAVKWQEKAIELSEDRWLDQMRMRLRLYQAHRPYRDQY